MTDEPAVAAEIAAIHVRLASIFDQPPAEDVVEELRRIRARLGELAAENSEIGDGPDESLDVAQRRPRSARR
jgi:hypothetical protein